QPVFTCLGACREAVKFELVNAIFLNHLKANVMKTLIIFRSGQRKSTGIGFESKLASVCDPLLFHVSVSAEWRKPNADSCPVFFSGRFQRRKAVWKPTVEFPQRPVVIPSIVEKK